MLVERGQARVPTRKDRCIWKKSPSEVRWTLGPEIVSVGLDETPTDTLKKKGKPVSTLLGLPLSVAFFPRSTRAMNSLRD